MSESPEARWIRERVESLQTSPNGRGMVPVTLDMAEVEKTIEEVFDRERGSGVCPEDLGGAEVFYEDVEILERAGESLMRSKCFEDAVACFSIALKWRVELDQRDRRGNIETRTKRGAWAEMVATAWLMEQGYEVFRNVSPAGPVDLVAVIRGIAILVDVKTSNRRKSGEIYQGNRLTEEQQALGVALLFVNHDGTCEWSKDAVT